MFWKLIEKEGETPIPPYIKNTTLSESELRKRYQSVLARERASVAAPTASLHFTEKLIAELAKNGTRHTEVTLHVGLGTFAPIDERNIAEKKLFTEYFEVTEKGGGGRSTRRRRRVFPSLPSVPLQCAHSSPQHKKTVYSP